MKKLLIAGAAMAALAAAGSAHAAFPSFGQDTGPYIYITLTSAGAAVTFDNTVNPTYDGADDTYLAVINNTGSVVNAITLKSTDDIFGFDGDGIDAYGAGSNANDTTGYGGPQAYFTNITNVGGLETGVVNFIGGIAANGGTGYFSLEEALDSATFSTGGGGIISGGAPEPSTWAMMLVGVAGLGGALRMAGRKARAAVTA